MRMSLTRTDDSLTCVTESGDFDFGIGPACSTDVSPRYGDVGKLFAISCDEDGIETIVPKDESKSSYFGDEEARSCVVNLCTINAILNKKNSYQLR